MLPVAVDGADVTGLTLQTSAGSSIVGRIRFDAFQNGVAPMFSGVSLSPVPVDEDLSPGNPADANIHADGTFEIRGVNGPRRLQLTRQPESWTLKEIRVNGIDATDRILSLGRAEQSLSDVEVVLTDRVNVLGGSVSDEQGSARARRGRHRLLHGSRPLVSGVPLHATDGRAGRRAPSRWPVCRLAPTTWRPSRSCPRTATRPGRIPHSSRR